MPAPLHLPRAAVHVWTAQFEPFRRRLEAFSEILAPDERQRAARFQFDRDRDRFIVGRALLRTILAGYLGTDPAQLVFDYGPHGKPALGPGQNPDQVRFNLSHSGGLFVYAMARAREVGLDIELIRPVENQEAIARRYFTPAEAAALNAHFPPDSQRLFFTTWTRREALAKGLGLGLGLAAPGRQIQTLRLSAKLPDIVEVDDPAGARRPWELRDVPVGPEYAAALAGEGAGWELLSREWTDLGE